jgi:hypothetical protein
MDHSDICTLIDLAQLSAKVFDGKWMLDITDLDCSSLVSHLATMPYDATNCKGLKYLLRIEQEGDRRILYIAPTD